LATAFFGSVARELETGRIGSSIVIVKSPRQRHRSFPWSFKSCFESWSRFRSVAKHTCAPIIDFFTHIYF
jgi:hypothetical protein